MKKYFFPSLIFVLSVAIALYNIGGFPKMIGDEGIYVSQAYWLAHFGLLGPYTYWYDHFPLGWAQIGLWQRLVGTTGFLGYTVLSARVFMGIILGGTTSILYLITHKITNSKMLSFFSAFIFISSAITLTFGRMVLLDNLAIFWLLLSLLLLISKPNHIKNLALSGLTLGIAILTKESLLFFLPPFLYLSYYLNRQNPNLKYAILVHYTTIFFLLFFFPLLAILKNELLPHSGNVSFVETLLFQSQRGSGIPFWNPESHFRFMLNTWMKIDPILLILGTSSVILSIILPLPRLHKIFAFFSLFFLGFLIRGGQIYEFYLIPLIPFLVLNISILLNYFYTLTKSNLLILISVLSFLGYIVTTNYYPFSSNATSTQIQSINTLKALPKNSTIIANNYGYLDIYLENKNQIHWYQKVESDPSVRESIEEITHILTDFQFDDELTGHKLPYLENLLKNQKPTTKFGILPAPGQNIKPYTNEFLSLYSLQTTVNPIKEIISLETLDSSSLARFVSTPPHAILIKRNNFTSSSDLEIKINLIKTSLPSTEIIVSQDSEGHNTIPWINTNSRSFFKSASESIEATTRKAVAIRGLGFTGAIVATSEDQDNYLQTIVDTSTSTLTPYVSYTGQLPKFNTNVIIDNDQDLSIIKNSGYQGKIYLLKQIEN